MGGAAVQVLNLTWICKSCKDSQILAQLKDLQTGPPCLRKSFKMQRLTMSKERCSKHDNPLTKHQRIL
jgi:hypothetical protein